MSKITREEHVAAYWEDRPHNTTWTDDAKIELSGKPYRLIVTVDEDQLKEYRVMHGQCCVNDWLSDEEKFEVVRYINRFWPEVMI